MGDIFLQSSGYNSSDDRQGTDLDPNVRMNDRHFPCDTWSRYRKSSLLRKMFWSRQCGQGENSESKGTIVVLEMFWFVVADFRMAKCV